MAPRPFDPAFTYQPGRRGRQTPPSKAKDNARSRAYRKKHRKAGLCVMCLTPRVRGYTHCQKHIDYLREWAYRKSKVLRVQQGRVPNIRSKMTREEYQWLHEAKSHLQQMKRYLKARGMLPPTV